MRNALLILTVFGLTLGVASCGACDEASVDVIKADQPILAIPSEPGKPFTSVIIDASGLNLERCMSPKIRRADGSEVWGTVKVDTEFVEDHGLVAYATSMDDAKKNPRCGLNPMIIKAASIAGGKFGSDPAILNPDADLLVAENAKGGFLEKFNVIFVKDGGPRKP